jgi:glutamate synthase domain-containing protein 1
VNLIGLAQLDHRGNPVAQSYVLDVIWSYHRSRSFHKRGCANEDNDEASSQVSISFLRRGNLLHEET